MRQSTPTVTLSIAASQMPAAWARLTAFLLHAHYDFLHTCHSPGHSDIDIFAQQRLLVRCTLRVADAATPVSPLPVAPGPEGLAAELVALLYDLVQAPSAEGSK